MLISTHMASVTGLKHYNEYNFHQHQTASTPTKAQRWILRGGPGSTALPCSSSTPRVYSTIGRCFWVFELILLRRRFLPPMPASFEASALACTQRSLDTSYWHPHLSIAAFYNWTALWLRSTYSSAFQVLTGLRKSIFGCGWTNCPGIYRSITKSGNVDRAWIYVNLKQISVMRYRKQLMTFYNNIHWTHT